MLIYLSYVDVISLFATGKSRKIKKSDENSYYWRKKSSYFPNDLSSFNETFKKAVPYDNIKGHKKQDFTHTFKNIVLKKPAF